jgi:hypothetical protein
MPLQYTLASRSGVDQKTFAAMMQAIVAAASDYESSDPAKTERLKSVQRAL